MVLLKSSSYPIDNTIIKSANKLGWTILNSEEFSSDAVFYAPGSSIFPETIMKPYQPSLDDFCNLPFKFLKRSVWSIFPDEVNHLTEPTFLKCWSYNLFPAKVYEANNFPFVEEDCRILASKPLTFDVEFRAFCADCKVQTISPYLKNGKLTNQASVDEWLFGEAFANEVAQEVGLIKGCVLDIGHCELGWVVIGLKPAWNRAFEGCDPVNALLTLQKSYI